jgi:glycerol-3-phosphate dehydrogenase (NAD(P)+)
MYKVAILGAGVMGTATAWPLSDNGHRVNLIGTHLDTVIIQSCKEKHFHPRLQRKLPDHVMPYFIEEIEQGLEGVDFIVSGVNSMGVQWIGQTLAPFAKPGLKIIAVTKGLEGDLQILPEVLRSELPGNIREQVSMAAIGGPCIAGELAGRRQSCVYFGSRDLDTARFLAQAFRTDYYHVHITDDILALEVAVALKNAYALGVGIAAGIMQKSGGIDQAGAHMHNMEAALFARGCMEIRQLLETLGANPDFAFNLPGAGDLFVTVQGGRSVTLGRLLGEGKTYQQAYEVLKGETLESAMIIQQMAIALPRLEQQGLLEPSRMPFMHALIDTIALGKEIKLDFDKFFKDETV